VYIILFVWADTEMYDAVCACEWIVGSVIDNRRFELTMLQEVFLKDKASLKLHNAQSPHSKATHCTCNRFPFHRNVQSIMRTFYTKLPLLPSCPLMLKTEARRKYGNLWYTTRRPYYIVC
jgi:hypothetical protein